MNPNRTNRWFKENVTMHQRISIREFLEKLPKHMRVWSLAPEYQQPVTRPKIDESVYKAAYALRKERPERRWVEIQGEAVILIPSSHGMAEFGTLETAGNMVPLFNQLKFSDDGPFASWANYKEIRSKFHIIRPSKIWQNYFYCSCYYGVKNEACKHNVFIMCEMGILQYPESVTSEQLQANRKRGRPKMVQRGAALQRD